LTKRYSDAELRQLRALQRAYSGGQGPDVVIFGDSNMFWTVPGESDRRHMAQLIRDELGGGVTVQAIVGGGYNARIILPFLAALERLPSKPRVVIVPASTVMASNIWLAHPVLGYEQVAAGLQRVVDEDDTKARRLDRPLDYGGKNLHKSMPADPAWETYSRMPAPSLIGQKRTVGELRMLAFAVPQTRWQKLVHYRHLLDYHLAERLEPDTPGVELVARMGAVLRDMKIPSVAYVSPMNHELAVKLLGPHVPEHVTRNVEIVRSAYEGAVGELGTFVDAAFQTGADGFSDVAHVKEQGRRELAAAIAAAAKPYLSDGQESPRD
jgi:hypothetical protein